MDKLFLDDLFSNYLYPKNSAHICVPDKQPAIGRLVLVYSLFIKVILKNWLHFLLFPTLITEKRKIETIAY